MEALEKGLHGSSLTGFLTTLCRALLVKSEVDFDRFDRCFLEYFRDVPFEQEVSEELLDWATVRNVLERLCQLDAGAGQVNEPLSEEEIEDMLKERMEEQKDEHNGGKDGWAPTDVHLRQLGCPQRGSGWGARESTAAPSGWRGSADSGISVGTTPWIPVSSQVALETCGSTLGWWMASHRVGRGQYDPGHL